MQSAKQQLDNIKRMQSDNFIMKQQAYSNTNIYEC